MNGTIPITANKENNKTIKGRLGLRKTKRSVSDLAEMSLCDNEQLESDMRNVSENHSNREQDDDIFYDSTNERENFKSDKSNETFNSCKVEENDLSNLYLNDNASDDKETKQILTKMMTVSDKKNVQKVEQNKRLRETFDFILRFIYPLTNGVVHGIKSIRYKNFMKILHYIASSQQAINYLMSFVANKISFNFSSEPVSLRIEAVLKLLKIRKTHDGIDNFSNYCTKRHVVETFTSPSSSISHTTITTSSPFTWLPRYSLPNFQSSGKKLTIEDYETIKCCSLNILAEPPSGQSIRADIVFIHGLNGSLANTWKQGLWEKDRRPVEFQRPPKPPIRPPKRPRHSRTNAVLPSHHKKRARFSHADIYQTFSQEKDSIDEADDNNYSCMCSETNDFELSDNVESSFPTFRLRMHDSDRLLQAEHDSTIQNESNRSHMNEKKCDRKTLNSCTNDENYSKCWPADWLPIDCPGVRVMALNYTTDEHLWRPLWKKKETRSNLIERSREMIELLIKYRVGYGHPIIWVGHSKGGLFIKQIIVDAWESGRPAAAPFWRSTRGVFFYSVPHRGSYLASIKPPFFFLRSVELIDIEKNNKYLLDLHRRFAGLYLSGHLKTEVFSFVETALTLMSVLYMRIVGVDSADPGIGDVCGIRLDHREICKPRNRDCILYKQLVNMINKVC